MKTVSLAACGVALVFLVGCNAGGQSPGQEKAQQDAKAKLDAFQKTAAQTAQTYKAMDNTTLLQKLAEQSNAKKEPFNSLAYRELQGRTNVNPESLVALVDASKNADGLLPLLLLRKLNQKAYIAIPAEERAAVLTNALETSKMFNTWGLLNTTSEEAPQAMIEAGESAYPALRRMLSDTRPAPLFGGQEHMIYQRNQYRVCDYALFFLGRMRGNADFRVPPTPGERDALIRQMAK